MPIEVNCENCGKKTFKQSYQLQKYNHHFCSRNCMFEYRKKHGIGKRRNNYHFQKLVTFAELRKEMLKNK